MARLRPAGRSDAPLVPVELLDPQGPTWRDPDLFADWACRHGLPALAELTGLTHWAGRHRAAVHAWATRQGLVNQTGRPDPDRLAELGIPHNGALLQAWARSELGRAVSVAGQHGG